MAQAFVGRRYNLIMVIIFLRGLPGSGKTSIAHKLEEKLDCAEVIHSDAFKIDYLKKHKDCDFADACKYSYSKTIKRLSTLSVKKIIIVEELFYDSDFVQKIRDFCREKNIRTFWFYLKRNLNKLLEIENSRKRKIKNTRGGLLKLQKDLDKIKIENEKIVLNDGNIDESVNFILENIKM